MTTFERRQRLLDLIHNEPGLRVPQMARVLSVSEGTVRNDLKSLAEEGQLIRVRGGAALPSAAMQNRNLAFSMRAVTNDPGKQWIGARAAAQVRDGMSILLDASTTVYSMATFLLERSNLRIVTNGVEVARLLAENPTHTVILVGGILRFNSLSTTGPWTEQFLEGLRTEIAFVSCSGFTPEDGMTDVDVYEAQFRVRAVESAGRVVALVDSSKFGRVDFTPSLRPGQIDFIYSDAGLSAGWMERLQRAHLPFELCGGE